MIIQPPDSRRIDELRKWLALVLPFAAVVVWVAEGFLFLWVPFVAILASLFLWPPGYEDPYFSSSSRLSREDLDAPEFSDRQHDEAMARERTRRQGGT
jgi:hypothetical protein